MQRDTKTTNWTKVKHYLRA